jgi:hypothetical protein
MIEYLTGMTAATDVDLTATVTFAVIQEEYLHLMVRSNATGTFSSGNGLNIYLGTTTAGSPTGTAGPTPPSAVT